MDSNKNVSSFNRLEALIQYYLDRITPFTTFRWLFNLFLLIIFFLRIILAQGYYIIAYGLGIFLLNQLILFLTPKLDPSPVNIDDDDNVPNLPTKSTDEFRPFIRRLPEFKFWYITFKALIISLILTLFSICDVPVYWPVLLIYFIALFLLSMRQRIIHMIHYKYVPFTYGKVRYEGKNVGQQGIKFSTN
ncbi:unnamed protein product [Rotaria sp. Silwood1]|nr:unnamed protein product [Rotaria sp. Silwood1]CAF0985293.1 unnamed protein product [Rotaria sp. Silwood1]CAF0994127.1 unnamed protein product [Rotaria sp. Silwood1]CAF3384008.1 unnamed protein product [Rotaria sp. Silwood1]CAF3405983.1 unnamed protein product [Rotaria sp. Silwood1]